MITSNRIVLSFKDSPRKPLRRRPSGDLLEGSFFQAAFHYAIWHGMWNLVSPSTDPQGIPEPSDCSLRQHEICSERPLDNFSISAATITSLITPIELINITIKRPLCNGRYILISNGNYLYITASPIWPFIGTAV